MAISIQSRLSASALKPAVERLFDVSGSKILHLDKTWKPSRGTPVFTEGGRYTTRGWTEWTQGFQFGSAILQFEATGDETFLRIGRKGTVDRMASHVSHIGVHDHGFNNVSTYGNLRRLMREGRIPWNDKEMAFYELALKISGAVQASRWTPLADGTGFVHSFNGPHSLFVDTIRSMRSLAVAHLLGHPLMGEQDQRISLWRRLVEHAINTARYSVYYGKGRDHYDVRGRTVHECVFNTASGVFRCPSSQQGYSPFSTWTRGLAWALCGFAEQLELIQAHRPLLRRTWKAEVGSLPGWSLARVEAQFLEAARATADFYLEASCRDGIPVWDTGAPGLRHMRRYQEKRSDPYNDHEPVDSSAAAIAAQGLLRLGRYLKNAGTGKSRGARTYRQAGLTVAQTLFQEPYLSTEPGSRHQGLILHSIYHRPNGWDAIPAGQSIPNGESSMWGDYHALELALMILREIRGESPLTFFDQPE